MPYSRKRKFSKKSFRSVRRRTGNISSAQRYLRARFKNGRAGRIGASRRAPVVTISDTEFLGDILGQQGPLPAVPPAPAYPFQMQFNHQLNPSVQALFPWVHNIATHFAEFKFKKLEFIYTPTSGIAVGGTNALGSLNMAFNPNALTVDPSTKQQLLMLDGAQTTSPAATSVFRVPCRSSDPWLFITSPAAMVAPPAAGLQAYDNRMSTHGTFYLSCLGVQAAAQGAPLGELRVRYTCQFRNPLLAAMNVIGIFILFSSYYLF